MPAGWFAVDNGDGTVTLTTTNVLPPSQVVNLPLVVDIDPAVAPGTSLQFGGAVSSSTTDPATTNNTANADTSVVAAADLTISKSGSPASVVAGGTVTYTIRITNTGPGLARSVDVKDQLPAGLTLAAASASDGGVCGGTVCQFGTLAVGRHAHDHGRAQVAADAPAGTVTNTAAVYSTDEANQANNAATANTTITTSADVRVRKVDAQRPGRADRGPALRDCRSAMPGRRTRRTSW